MIIYNIAEKFTDAPGGRFKDDGPYSGEEFRDDVLIPLIEECKKTKDKLELNFDDSFGYPTSFLEETFGGLIRESNISPNQLSEILIFISEDQPGLIETINKYINDAWVIKKR